MEGEESKTAAIGIQVDSDVGRLHGVGGNSGGERVEDGSAKGSVGSGVDGRKVGPGEWSIQ
jgi:hypothetical protein